MGQTEVHCTGLIFVLSLLCLFQMLRLSGARKSQWTWVHTAIYHPDFAPPWKHWEGVTLMTLNTLVAPHLLPPQLVSCRSTSRNKLNSFKKLCSESQFTTQTEVTKWNVRAMLRFFRYWIIHSKTYWCHIICCLCFMMVWKTSHLPYTPPYSKWITRIGTFFFLSGIGL